MYRSVRPFDGPVKFETWEFNLFKNIIMNPMTPVSLLVKTVNISLMNGIENIKEPTFSLPRCGMLGHEFCNCS